MKSQENVRNWYDKKGVECLNFFEKSQENEVVQIKKILKYLPKKAIILDVGCGIGKPVVKFLTEKGFEVIGIDISKEMIREAKLNVPKSKFKVMSMYDLKFPNKKFNAIFSFFSILHLEKNKVPSVFEEFNRILKDDGYLFFSVNKGKEEGYYDFFGEKVFFSSYTNKEIKEILSKSKFKLNWKREFIFEKGNSKEYQLYYFAQKSPN